jgi:hypothetical protein
MWEWGICDADGMREQFGPRWSYELRERLWTYAAVSELESFWRSVGHDERMFYSFNFLKPRGGNAYQIEQEFNSFPSTGKGCGAVNLVWVGKGRYPVPPVPPGPPGPNPEPAKLKVEPWEQVELLGFSATRSSPSPGEPVQVLHQVNQGTSSPGEPGQGLHQVNQGETSPGEPGQGLHQVN